MVNSYESAWLHYSCIKDSFRPESCGHSVRYDTGAYIKASSYMYLTNVGLYFTLLCTVNILETSHWFLDFSSFWKNRLRSIFFRQFLWWNLVTSYEYFLLFFFCLDCFSYLNCLSLHIFFNEQTLILFIKSNQFRSTNPRGMIDNSYIGCDKFIR